MNYLSKYAKLCEKSNLTQRLFSTVHAPAERPSWNQTGTFSSWLMDLSMMSARTESVTGFMKLSGNPKRLSHQLYEIVKSGIVVADRNRECSDLE
jgi:hypothetical protein